VDNIDNKQRCTNVIIFGAPRGDPYAAVERFLQDRPQLWRNLDEAFFLGKGNGRRPLLVRFALVSACNDCIAFSHTATFIQKFQGVAVVRDRSDLRRTGVSRLKAAGPALRAAFPGIKVHQHHDFVEYEGTRINAVDFAASGVLIGDSLFDIDKACTENEEVEITQGVFVRVGDTIVFGYRCKDGTPLAPEDEADEDDITNRVPDADTGRTSETTRPERRQLNKRTLAGAEGLTDGGLRFFDGQNRHRGSTRGSVVMGQAQDPFDVRHCLSHAT
jgi:hypothetical protein